MKECLNVAVVGAGIFGTVHIRSFRQHGRVNLVKICESNPKRAEAVRQEYGVPVCSNYREIAADESIDAVGVATPDHLHREVVVAMLQAGKHVLVEKPLATSTTDAREMVRAAEQAKKHLMIDFQNRWNPPFIEAKKRIADGEFGDPVTGWARLANTLYVPRQMLSWSGQSGPHWFLLPHVVDMICWLYERPVKRVMAYGRKEILKKMGMDTYDAIQAMLFFDDCVATVETAWIMPESRPNLVDWRVFLQGTRAVISVDPLAPTLEITGEKFQWPITGAFQDAFGRVQGWQATPILHFVDRLLAGQKPMCDGREGFHNTAVIAAIVKSVESGKMEPVEQL